MSQHPYRGTRSERQVVDQQAHQDVALHAHLWQNDTVKARFLDETHMKTSTPTLWFIVVLVHTGKAVTEVIFEMVHRISVGRGGERATKSTGAQL